MNVLQYEKLEKLAYQLKQESKTIFKLQKDDIIESWNKAVYYNKISNQFAEDPEFLNDPVYQFHAKDLEDGELKYFNITARHNYNRIQFFKLFILINCFYLPYQEAKEVFNKELKAA